MQNKLTQKIYSAIAEVNTLIALHIESIELDEQFLKSLEIH